MTDGHRAQRLRDLLARVQANAARSVPGRPAQKSVTAWPTDDAYTSFPDTRRTSVPPPPSMMEDVRAFREASLGARYQAEDRWTSLLSGALEASPPRAAVDAESARDDVPQLRALHEPATDVTGEPQASPDVAPSPRVILIAPQPADPPVMRPEAREAPRPPPEPIPSDPPSSALERAIAKVAKERAAQMADGEAIWGDVVDQLRERRSTTRPEAVRPQELPKAPDSGSTSETPLSPASEARRSNPFHAMSSGPPSFGSSRLLRRRLRGAPSRRAGERPPPAKWLGWGLAAAGATGVAIASIVLVPRFLPGSPTRDGVTVSAQPLASSSKPLPVPPSASGASTGALVPSASASASTEPRPPSNAADLPANLGYVLFASERPLHVYLNGRLAGETGEWLRVECEFRNVRFSERTVPKIGSSFPTWTGEGHTVIVPCRVATRFLVPPGAGGLPEVAPK